jgi:hypothetical protein
MNDLVFDIFGLFGIIFFFWCIVIFFITVLRLIWKPKSLAYKSSREKTSELYSCDLTFLGNSD